MRGRVLSALVAAALVGGYCGGVYAQPIGSVGSVLSDVSAVGQVPADNTVARLTRNSRVTRAFTEIEADNARGVRETIELTEIPAPPFGEGPRGIRFAAMLREAGLNDVNTDSAGNVIGRMAGRRGAKTVAIVAHLDTVFPIETDVRVRVEGDTLYAPGVGDNSRGLVVLLTLVRAMKAAGLQTDADLLFVGSVGEEGLGDLRGVKALFADGSPKIDSFIAVDGGDAGRLIHKAVGSNRYRITYKGPGGHSWGAFGMANPHHALGRAIMHLAARGPRVTSHGAKTSYSVGRIGGGTSINSIPFESWMEVDMRSGDRNKLAEMDAVFRDAVIDGLNSENSARKHGPKLTVDIAQVGRRPAGQTPESSTLVQNAMAAMRHKGIQPRLSESSTDSNIPMSKQIPAITMSRGGRSRKAHSPDESWTNENAHVAIQVLLLTILAEAGI
jgi:acetylornithine deacetylase/succinyl-diaminopimelate desuccinylase-like protein